MFEAPIHKALKFLTNLHNSGHKYGQINTACSAISAVINVPGNISFGKLPVVRRFMKGIFELKPCFPKYTQIWNVTKVFDFFRSLPDHNLLNLKMLTPKIDNANNVSVWWTEIPNYSLSSAK